ncbi:MAG: ATPase, partial [Parafilimonas sp.]
EILHGKLNDAAQKSQQQSQQNAQATKASQKKETGFFDSPAIKQAERTAASVITRSLLGALGLGGRRKKSSLW